MYLHKHVANAPGTLLQNLTTAYLQQEVNARQCLSWCKCTARMMLSMTTITGVQQMPCHCGTMVTNAIPTLNHICLLWYRGKCMDALTRPLTRAVWRQPSPSFASSPWQYKRLLVKLRQGITSWLAQQLGRVCTPAHVTRESIIQIKYVLHCFMASFSTLPIRAENLCSEYLKAVGELTTGQLKLF